MNKKIFALIVVCFICGSGWAQTFSEVDLERMLMNHPIMKNYDPSTGHFRNTPYAMRNVKELKAENISLNKELKELSKKESLNSKTMLNEDIDDEDAFWNNVSSFSKRKFEIKRTISKNEDLIASKGDPGHEKLLPIVTDMANDLFVPLYANNKIVLNKLPRYFIKKPDMGANDFHHFWFNKDKNVLDNYLSYSSVITLIFSKSDRAILYYKNGENK